MAKRRCKGTTKKGARCGSPPLRPGTIIEGVTVKGEHCRTHDPDLPDSARIQGAQPGAGRPRTPRVVDVMRERVEERVDEVLAAYFETLENATLHTFFFGELITTNAPDYGARMKAAEKLLDRVYGRPTQRTELGSDVNKPVRISAELLADPKLRDELRAVTRRVAAARSGGARRPRSGS